MLNKIVVPTDFSANSKAGIRFGIQLAAQAKSSLIFYHAMEILKPVRWTNEQFDKYVKNQLSSTRAELAKFAEGVYEQLGLKSASFECVVERGGDPKKMVIDFAVKIKATAICMGTRGAGKIKKIIGTNSSGILTSSPVPVFVIPRSYRNKPIRDILYASDLDNVQSELKRVSEFASPLKASVYVYHYNEKIDDPATNRKLLQIQTKNNREGVSFIFEKFDPDQYFAEHLDADIKRSKASVAVLFTNQKRGWYDKIFQPSKSAEVSFSARVPLLVFSKQ